MMVNDTSEVAQGRLELAWQRDDGHMDGTPIGKSFSVAPFGQMTYVFEAVAPLVAGKYKLVAKAFATTQPGSPTICRRKVEIVVPVPSK
jgi:hypothetical protein